MYLDPPFVVLFLDLLWILVGFVVRTPQKELQMGVQVYIYILYVFMLYIYVYIYIYVCACMLQMFES